MAATKPSSPVSGVRDSALQEAMISIAPQHASRIYSGDKHYEFRRTAAGLTAGTVLWIYETAPISAITGQAVVGKQIFGTPEKISSLEVNPPSRDHVNRYLAGSKNPVALELSGVEKFDAPIRLPFRGVRRAPQSYQFLRT